MACSKEVDVVVIGAGVSGLYAAYCLKKRGQSFVVLEAKDRIGGRTCVASLKCKNGTDKWDMGGQWLGLTQYLSMDLLKEFGLEFYPQYTTGKKKLMLRSPDNIVTYSGLIPYLSPLHLLDFDRFQKKLEKLCETLDLDDLLAHPNAREWDSITLHSYVNDNCRYPVTKEIFESAIRVILGVDLSQVSLFYILYYAKQAGSIQALIDNEKGGAQEYRVKGSVGQICDKMAEKVESENIICGDPVFAMDQPNNGYVEVTTSSGKKYRGKHVIVAIPPHLVNDIKCKPPLPFDRIKLGEQMPVGHLIKFVVTYQSMFWRDNGMSGESVVTGVPCSIGPITVTFDGTTSNGNPAIVGFICAEHAIYWSRRTMAERKEAVLGSLATMLGEDCLDPIHYEDKDWAKEPYNGGCPVSIMRPRGLLYFHHALRRPFGRIHWAGTETARLWVGYIEGALEAGKRASSEILDGDESKAVEWKESVAFERNDSYVSHLERKRSWFWISSVLVGLAGFLGYYFMKNYQE